MKKYNVIFGVVLIFMLVGIWFSILPLQAGVLTFILQLVINIAEKIDLFGFYSNVKTESEPSQLEGLITPAKDLEKNIIAVKIDVDKVVSDIMTFITLEVKERNSYLKYDKYGFNKDVLSDEHEKVIAAFQNKGYTVIHEKYLDESCLFISWKEPLDIDTCFLP